MKGEVGKVIEFPKKVIENTKRKNKFNAAFKMLKELVENGADFQIVVNKEDSLLYFNESDFGSREYMIITSNLEKSQELILNNENSCTYPINGYEF